MTNLDDAGAGSLRQTISDATGDSSPPTVIDFSPGLHGLLDLISGPLAITKSMRINGPGASAIELDGNGGNSQILTVNSSSTVSVSGLRFAFGHVAAPDGSPAAGGAIANDGTLTVSDALFDHNSAGTPNDPTNNSGSGSGGAISNDGTLTVHDSTFTDNTAGGHGGAGVDTSEGTGGAIFSSQSLTVTGSTFTGNSAGGDGGAGDVSGAGGGGAIAAVGSMTLVDSTITGNSAGGATGGALESGQGLGGGLIVLGRATTTLQSDTIDANAVGSAPGSDGAGVANDGPASVTGTIVSGNTGARNCTNSVNGMAGSMSARDSLEGPAGQTSCGFDLPSADPRLGALGGNGGPTQTQALAAGSPAIGAVGLAADCLATDQRGSGRPRGGCDVGAYEAAPPVLGPASASNVGLTTASLGTTLSNPDILSGSVSFQYGTSIAYGSSTASQPLPADLPATGYGASIAGLTPGTTYHYRVVATNPDGTVVGPDQQFTTASLAGPPVASNLFRFGKAKVGPRGAITVLVNAPDSGRFTARVTFTVITHRGRKRVKTTFTYGNASVRSTGRGTFRLVIGLSARAARELKQLGSRQVTIAVTFTPTGGTARHATKKLTVRRNRGGKYS